MTTMYIAGHHYPADPATPDQVHVYFPGFATPGEAREFIARFPKRAKLIVSTPAADGTHTVQTGIHLAPTTVNGGINETGLARYRSVRRTAAKLGIPTAYDRWPGATAYPTEEALHAALNLTGAPA